MAKVITFDREAKEKILKGICTLEKATTTTLGPNGKTVIIDGPRIHATKDGVSVARSIQLRDPIENIGVKAIQEVAEKSNKNAGDGTTTSVLLTRTIFENGLHLSLLGANTTKIKRGIDKAAKAVVEFIENSAIQISTKDEIKKVAMVSANGDEEIGEIISDVMSKLGPHGEIKVDNGNTTEIQTKIIEGMSIDKGYISPIMANNDRMEADLTNPLVLISELKINTIQEIAPVMNIAAKAGRPLVVIADDYAEDVIATMVINKYKGALNIVAIKAPSFAEYRRGILDDIAILTFGQVIANDNGVTFEKASTEHEIIGEAERIVVTNNQTIIIGGTDTKEAVAARVESLKTLLDATEDEYDKKQLQKRIAKLSSGVGVISVGAHTEAEQKERRDRVDDAFYASRSAIRTGVVAGGGSALIQAMRYLDEHAEELTKVDDEKLGVKILRDSLRAPMTNILNNAGIDGSLMVAKLLDQKDPAQFVNMAYNINTGKFENMIELGILDAAGVVINEISNASSVAGTLLTTEAVIIDDPDEKKDQQIVMPQMPMM